MWEGRNLQTSIVAGRRGEEKFGGDSGFREWGIDREEWGGISGEERLGQLNFAFPRGKSGNGEEEEGSSGGGRSRGCSWLRRRR